MKVNGLVATGGPHVLLNTHGWQCRHCKEYHDVYTINCRPIVFAGPQQLNIHMRRVVNKTDGKAITDIEIRTIGTPQAISEMEALRIDPNYRRHPVNRIVTKELSIAENTDRFARLITTGKVEVNGSYRR